MWSRGLGGVMYLTGALIMVWNLWMTAVTKGSAEARKDAPCRGTRRIRRA
jgi:cbb3-type cytochrome oxidase subunit 1